MGLILYVVYTCIKHAHVIAYEEKDFFFSCTLTNDIIRGEAVSEYYGRMNGRGNIMTRESWAVRCSTWTVKYGDKRTAYTLRTTAVEKSFLLLLDRYYDFYMRGL